MLKTVIIGIAILGTSVAVAAPPMIEVLRPGDVLNAENDPVNRIVVNDSVNALVVQLEIQGDDTAVRHVSITKVPAGMVDFGRDASKIVVEVFNRNNELVGRTSVADRKISSRDGETIVHERRRVSVIVPILRRPETMAITVPGAAPQPGTLVTRAVAPYCRRFPQADICSDEPPESSPFFERLRQE